MLLDHFMRQSTLFHMASCKSIWLQELERYICQNIQSIAALKVDNVMCLEHTPSRENGEVKGAKCQPKENHRILYSGEREKKEKRPMRCCNLI